MLLLDFCVEAEGAELVLFMLETPGVRRVVGWQDL
jgi:hypothetical protein